ncbi:MAG: nicotinate phosphoribosyltransferase [Bacteroidota bacterium]
MLIHSILDNDLYKFTTQYAVRKLYPQVDVQYSFIDRSDRHYPDDFHLRIKKEVEQMTNLALTGEEEQYIREHCPWFDNNYIRFLKEYRFNPSEVKVTNPDNQLKIDIEGNWMRTILWEVPLLAIVSEAYYQVSGQKPTNTIKNAAFKGRRFREMEAKYTDFGTRRRFSFDVQDQVVKTLKNESGDFLTGTSNVFLARKNNIKPIGTHPHEWFMFHGVQDGYAKANKVALQKWLDVFKGELAVALTDTYTTDVFLQQFDKELAEQFYAVRWDSGDPLVFTDKMVAFYKKQGIDPASKTIIYSDALNVERVAKIKEYLRQYPIKDGYGIGTYLTNDVGAQPLDIVIKLTAVRLPDEKIFRPACKLSDVPGKNTGDPAEVARCQEILGVK